METVVLALDIGSSSAKALAYDLRGRSVRGLESRSVFGLDYGPGGEGEIDLPKLVGAVEAALEGLLGQLGGRRVAAVSISSLVSSLVPLDAHDQPLEPVLSYADARSAAWAERVPPSLERTGCPKGSAYWPAQIAWWRSAHPNRAERVRRWVSVCDYLYLRWFGGYCTSYGLAAWTGLLDRHTLQWDAPLLDWLELSPDQLPALLDSSQALVGLRPPYAERWPQLRQVPFFVGLGDGAATNVGSGAMGESRVAVSIGTTAALRMALPGAPTIPEGLWAYRFSRNWSLLGGALTEGGNLYPWLLEVLRLDSPQTLEARMAALEPVSPRLTWLPSLGGERSPGYRAEARGAFYGLTFSTTPLELARAALEAVALRLCDLNARLSAHPDRTYIGSGGTLRASPLWAQIVADALGAELWECTEPEASARGAALLALESIGELDPLETAPALGRCYTPDPQRHALYRQALERQQKLYRALLAQELF